VLSDLRAEPDLRAHTQLERPTLLKSMVPPAQAAQEEPVEVFSYSVEVVGVS